MKNINCKYNVRSQDCPGEKLEHSFLRKNSKMGASYSRNGRCHLAFNTDSLFSLVTRKYSRVDRFRCGFKVAPETNTLAYTSAVSMAMVKKFPSVDAAKFFKKIYQFKNVFPLVLLSLNILCAIQILVCSYLSFCVLWCYHFCPGDIFSKNNIRCNKNFFSSFKVCQSKLECLPFQINFSLA